MASEAKPGEGKTVKLVAVNQGARSWHDFGVQKSNRDKLDGFALTGPRLAVFFCFALSGSRSAGHLSRSVVACCRGSGLARRYLTPNV
jgi:hypothetical protein